MHFFSESRGNYPVSRQHAAVWFHYLFLREGIGQSTRRSALPCCTSFQNMSRVRWKAGNYSTYHCLPSGPAVFQNPAKQNDCHVLPLPIVRDTASYGSDFRV